MKKIILLIILAIASCSKPQNVSKRNPSSVEEGKLDLIELSRSYSDELTRNNLRVDNCLEKLNLIEASFKRITPADLDTNQITIDGKSVLDELFNTRIILHSMLGNITSECKLKMKDVFLAIRSVEDLAGIMFYKDPQISADKINYQLEKTPIFDAEAYRPYHSPDNSKFSFKNGDIMITKGISFVSSTISEVATPRALFSHIVFVHVNELSKEVTTIESYVGKGVEIYPIEVALKNENSRILVLRAKDEKLAASAANYMYDRVMKLKEKKKFIPYDYALDFTENKKLSCEEVAFDSFKTMSNGAFLLPETESNVNIKDDKFLSRLGIKRGPMMVPTDMETDSRFNIAVDWTDYRVMRDSWRKDAVLGEMFRWSDEYNYQIHENFTSVAARLIWSTRYVPGLWNMMAKVSGLPVDFTKDVPGKTIATMASLKEIGGILLPIITAADEDSHNLTGRWMSSKDLRKYLNTYRETNPKDLLKLYSKTK